MKEFGEFLAVLVLGMIVGFAMAFAIAALLHWGVPPLWLAIFVGGASLWTLDVLSLCHPGQNPGDDQGAQRHQDQHDEPGQDAR